mgnify:CR=1 FL=1
MRSMKGKRGITLIALAVTIVVILILAGVTIDVTLGENGILNKSKETANRMNNLVKEDESELNELLNELNKTMESNWNSNIEIPEDNTIPDPGADKPTKVEDVTEIQKETIQVEDEYGNKVTIPKGFEVVEEEGTAVPEGIVIQDKDGNQFVWIPVGRVYKDNTGENYSDIQLGRYTFNSSNGKPKLIQAAYTKENSKNYEKQVKLLDGFYYIEYCTRGNPDGIASSGDDGLNAIARDLTEFVESVRNYEGYYLGRYEASYGSGNSVIDYMPLSKISTGTPRNNKKTTLVHGMLWNFVTQIEAANISRNMYDKDYDVGVESDLVNSYAFDTAIVFIQEMGNSNYANLTSVNVGVINTGMTKDKVCNIFDLSQNCAEWTTEYCTEIENGTVRTIDSVGENFCTRYRYNYPAINKNKFTSFRVILYIIE